MRLTRGYEFRRARIEMTPLIDVVFLVLVYFIYASMCLTVNRGVTVVLPRAAGESGKGKTFVITITQDNAIMVGNRAVKPEEAVAEAARRTKAEGASVIVNGDARADLGTAVELLSKLRQAGLEKASFLVKPEGGAAPKGTR